MLPNPAAYGNDRQGVGSVGMSSSPCGICGRGATDGICDHGNHSFLNGQWWDLIESEDLSVAERYRRPVHSGRQTRAAPNLEQLDKGER